MLDIRFYMSIHGLNKRLLKGEKIEREFIQSELEKNRSRKPVVYNIETTNACNMKCQMCPRTTRMTRPVKTMSPELFEKLIDQIECHGEDLWREWEQFVVTEYGIPKDDMSENHFFLYIIPKVLQLHGYGDPLLDRHMAKHVRLLKSRGIPSYFSCNPSNIDLDRTLEMFENGLNYIKYSIESTEDNLHKEIRGQASDFSESYQKILSLLDMKKKENFGTVIIITMLNLNRADQMREYEFLRKKFAGLDVYIYLKSEDQQWYRKDYHGTCSVHWSEFCKHPWMTMTIKSNGEAAMCMEDYDNEIILGNAEKDSLESIWNGQAYGDFRMAHFDLKPDMKCTKECDMKLIGHYCR